MAERKRNRNAQTLKRRQPFRISRKPVVSLSADEAPGDVSEIIGVPQEHGARILFAIAKDPRTIFASWHIDWASLFEKVTPVDRQVHLRVFGADGVEEKSVAVEPMAVMHYVTTSGLHASYRVEIGYYHPAETWRLVAASDEIMMPPNRVGDTTDVDLATIPFHIGFQQLLDLFRLRGEMPLAVAISRVQTGLLSTEHLPRLAAQHERVLRGLEISLSEIAAARRAFMRIDCQKLTTRTDMVLGFDATSWARSSGANLAAIGS